MSVLLFFVSRNSRSTNCFMRPHLDQRAKNNHQDQQTLMATVQEEQERRSAANRESQLTMEKQKLQAELMALQTKKNDVTDPTEESESSLESATAVSFFFLFGHTIFYSYEVS